MVKSFPGITTKETSVVPPIKPKNWRETLGVVAKFRKGPPIARVKSLEDLANYFGDDNKEGALTIHTAMDNSTRDFVVSRPIPSNTSAYVSFDLETQGTPQQSYVDDTGDVPTHGISLLSEYVSDVSYRTPCSSNVRSIKKHLNSDLAGVNDGEFGNPDFQTYLDGQGTLNFRSELYLEGGGSNPATPRQLLDSIKLFNPEVNGSRIYSANSLSGFGEDDSIAVIVEIGSLEGLVMGTNPFEDFIKGHIIPGAKLQLTGRPASIKEEAEVLSPPEEYYNVDEDYTAYRFAVKLTFDQENPEIGTGDWIELIDVNTPTLGEIRFPEDSMYIFSYSWNPLTPNASPKASQGEYITGMFPSYIEGSFVDGYVIFDQNSGVKKAEVFNFFLEWNRDLTIQLAPVKPVNLVDFDINSVAELSSNTIGFSPAKLKMLDEGNTLFDVVLNESSENVQGEGSLTLRSEPYFRGSTLPQNPKSELNSLKIYNPEVNGSRLYESISLNSGDSFVTVVEFNTLENYTFNTNEFDNFVKDNILPGVEISLTATDANLNNPVNGIAGTAEVLSPPEKYYNVEDDQDYYRFAIRITTNADTPTLGTGDWIELMDQETPTSGEITFPSQRYVFSYTWTPIKENAAPNVVGGGNHITNMFPSYTSSSWVDGYVVFEQETGQETVELFNFFNFWNKDDHIQISPTAPLDLVQLDTSNLEIDSYDDLNYATLSFNASNVEMLSGTGLVYDDLLSNVRTPSTFAVRIDQALASVGRPFTDQLYEIPALEVGTPFADVMDLLFSQLNEMDDSSEQFSDFSKDSVYDRMSTNTILSTRLETRAEGLTANNMTIRVCLTGDGPANVPPSDVVNDGWTTIYGANLVKTISKSNSNFELAKQGAAPASRIFYTDTGEPLLRIEAVSPGQTDLEVTIKPRRSGQFDVIIVDRDSEEYYDSALVERIQLTNKGANQNGSGLYPASQNSKLIKAYYLPRRYGLSKKNRQEFETKNPARIGSNLGTFVPDANNFNDFEGTPSVSTLAVGETYLSDVKLLGGTDGTNGNNPSNEDYIEAVKRLEGFDLVVLTCPDIKFNGNPEQPVIKEMIRQAEDSDSFNGLRQAVFQLPRKLPVTRLKSIVPQSLNNERVVLIAGYTTYSQKPEVGFNQVPILGTYLGWTYSRPPYVSPAAISRTESIKAATTSSIPGDEAYLSALSENGIEGIYFDKSVQRLRFANGQTTSTDIEGQYLSVVRTYDQITMDLAQRLSFVRSQPLSEELMRRISGICDTRLEYLVSQGWIARYNPTIVDERNNSDADLRQGKVNVDINIEVFVPADHIILNFLRERTRTLTLQTQT